MEKRILLVEDYEDTRFSLSKLLEFEGYDVVEAVDGNEAVALAREHLPGLILMDLTLPGIDGLTATREIKQSQSLASVPIVALSGHEHKREEALEAGCAEYVIKPVDFDQLIQTVNRLFPGVSVRKAF